MNISLALFWIGLGATITGVAMLSIPLALTFCGLLLIGISIVAHGEEKKKRERK